MSQEEEKDLILNKMVSESLTEKVTRMYRNEGDDGRRETQGRR